MKAAGLVLALVAAALCGCSGSSGLTTASLVGGDESKPAGPTNDPPMRAFQVGTTSARAVKCGFNFDPAKLKANYLAFEAKQPGAGDAAKVERIYDVSFNGVAKAVAGEGEYCSDAKTKSIKTDLTRHLAGDYTPAEQPKVAQEEGLFSWGSDSGSENKTMKAKLPTDNSDD